MLTVAHAIGGTLSNLPTSIPISATNINSSTGDFFDVDSVSVQRECTKGGFDLSYSRNG